MPRCSRARTPPGPPRPSSSTAWSTSSPWPAAGRAQGARVPVVLEVDIAFRPLGSLVHIGVRRSPLRCVGDVVALARRAAAAQGLTFHGIMAYEAQIAGLPDRRCCREADEARLSSSNVVRTHAEVQAALQQARPAAPRLQLARRDRLAARLRAGRVSHRGDRGLWLHRQPPVRRLRWPGAPPLPPTSPCRWSAGLRENAHVPWQWLRGLGGGGARPPPPSRLARRPGAAGPGGRRRGADAPSNHGRLPGRAWRSSVLPGHAKAGEAPPSTSRSIFW